MGDKLTIASLIKAKKIFEDSEQVAPNMQDVLNAVRLNDLSYIDIELSKDNIPVIKERLMNKRKEIISLYSNIGGSNA